MSANPLKYDPVNSDRINQIVKEYKEHPLLDYIKELYLLIEYQRKLIVKQEKDIIALKHTNAWKHYDKPIELYDTKTRKYKDK
jgi:hypothetical protein